MPKRIFQTPDKTLTGLPPYRLAVIHDERGDIVVEITVGGSRRYLDKAKYPEAKRLGLQRCTNGFYIDRIYTSKGQAE